MYHDASYFTNIVLQIKIGANAGIIGMTKEHLSLALCLNVPVFIVVTKIDMCPERVKSIFPLFSVFIFYVYRFFHICEIYSS